MKLLLAILGAGLFIPVIGTIDTHFSDEQNGYKADSNTPTLHINTRTAQTAQSAPLTDMHGGLPIGPKKGQLFVKAATQATDHLDGGDTLARAAGPMSYKLDQTSRTSAGVYDGDRLVRTLWGNKLQSPGTYSLANAWDGTDDDGKAVADKSYTIKVLSSQVSYQWLAPIGNTSLDSTGPGVHNSMQLYTNMVQVGQDMYCANGYNEIGDTHRKFAIGQPNRLTTTLKSGCMVARFIATDGQRVYYAGEARGDVSFTTAIIPKPGGTDILYSFSNGRAVAISGNNSYKYSGIDYETNNNDPTGLAVQAKGDFLFVSHGSLNQLRVLNKNTGALVRTITVTNPGELKINESILWMMSEGGRVSRYTIGADGTLSPATLTLTGLTEPLAIGLSADGTTLAVCDRGVYHQVKLYETASGRLIRTIGRAENYTNPTVYDDKFYFNNTRIFTDSDYGAAHAFVSFQSDGSIWIGDYGNMRCQHFNANGAYINNIQYMGYSYSCQVDANDPRRVFSDFLEFNIDYITNKWRFTQNWSKNITKPASYDEDRMRSVATLGNGRTYCLYNETPGKPFEVLELILNSGLRHTGLYLDNAKSDINSDGSQWQIGSNEVGKPTFWQRRSFTGFDAKGNPQWGPAAVIEKLAAVTQADPLTAGGYLRRQQYTTNGIVIGFSSDNGKTERGRGYHLGGVKGGEWLFRVSPSTRNDYVGDYPNDGAFDIGNGVNYAASFMQVVDSSIFWGYKGENWKQGQTNMYQHYLDDGLLVGQFGVTQEIARLEGESPAQMAGNANSGSYVKVGNDIHFFHADEGQHAGVHHWKISKLNSIRVETFPLVGGAQTAQKIDNGCINLMDGLPVSGTIASGVGRWKYTPATYNKGPYDRWQVTAGLSTYRRGERSIRLTSYPTVSGQRQEATCDLTIRSGTVNQFNSWTLTGAITYPELSEAEYNYLELLDNAGKTIVRLSRPESYPYASINANGSTLVRGLLSNLMSNLLGHAQVLEVNRLGDSLQVRYGAYSVANLSVFEKGADAGKPTQLRARFYSAGTRGHQIDIANLNLCYTMPEQNNTCTTIKDGIWTDPTVWLCNHVPAPTDVVYLRHNLTVPSNYTAYVDQVIYVLPVRLIYQTGSNLLLNK